MSGIQRRTIPWRILTTTLLALVWTSTAVGQPEPTLPSNWQSLAPAEFAAALRDVYKPHDDEFLIELDENAVRQHAATLYNAIDLNNTGLDEQAIDIIQGLAYPELDDGRKAADLDVLLNRQTDWTGKPYAAARARYGLLWRLRGPLDARDGAIRAWANTGGDLTQITTEDLPLMRKIVSDWKELKDSCTVTWTGQITAPTTGMYTFSVPDLNISAQSDQQHEPYDLQHSVVTTVNGTQLLNSTPDQFQREGASIELAAGQPVAFEMSSTFDSPKIPNWVAHAVLYWSGPGITDAIVPTDAFTNLQETFHWQEVGAARTHSRSVSNIDRSWPAFISFGADQAYQSQVADLLWQRTMENAYLSRCENQGELHPFLRHTECIVDIMSTERCVQFMNEAIARPAIVESFHPKEMLDAYRCLRMKDTEKALDVFGLWSILNADCPCRMPLQYTTRMRHFKEHFMFDYYNQRTWRTMAQCVSEHTPSHARRLEAEFLVLQDGRCNLPVAQVLAYVYMADGKHAEWVAMLDERLNDGSLSGDQKANWYLAAAHAREIRLGPHNDIYAIVNLRPVDAMTLLETAFEAASDVGTKLRISRETAARYSAVRDFGSARDALQQAADIAPPDRVRDVADWQHSVTRFETHQQEQRDNRQTAAAEAYVARLRERRDRAAARGDDAAVQRYGALIEARQNEDEP